ncbi:MAG TPA: hypothetical protein VJN94_11875, partial [Candidatus Binataceae bacterium]|nr:hypothetical protein [Candidatus Binataceae bacterium]
MSAHHQQAQPPAAAGFGNALGEFTQIMRREYVRQGIKEFAQTGPGAQWPRELLAVNLARQRRELLSPRSRWIDFLQRLPAGDVTPPPGCGLMDRNRAPTI